MEYVLEKLQTEQRHVIKTASEKGESNWLTALSLKMLRFQSYEIPN